MDKINTNNKIEKTEKNTTFIINETPKASSYEFGKAGNRFKLYFSTIRDLVEQINELKKRGLYQENGI